MPVRFLLEFTLGQGPWADTAKDEDDDALTLEPRWISHNRAEFANKKLTWKAESRDIDWVNYAVEFPKIQLSGFLTAAFRNDTLGSKDAIFALQTLAKYDQSRVFKLIAVRSGPSVSDFTAHDYRSWHEMARLNLTAKVLDVVPSQTDWDTEVYWIVNFDSREASSIVWPVKQA